MEMTWEQFNNSYKSASDDVRTIIDSDALPMMIEEYVSEHPQMNYAQVMKVASRFVLGIFTEKEVEEMIPDSRTLITKLNNVLGKSSPQDSLPQANNKLKEKLELRPESAVQQPRTVAPPQEGAMKPLTRDEVLQALSPKRTMQSDISAIKVDDSE